MFAETPLTVNNFTFELYRWAVSSVSTRINLIPSKIAVDEIGNPLLVSYFQFLVIFFNYCSYFGK